MTNLQIYQSNYCPTKLAVAIKVLHGQAEVAGKKDINHLNSKRSNNTCNSYFLFSNSTFTIRKKGFQACTPLQPKQTPSVATLILFSQVRSYMKPGILRQPREKMAGSMQANCELLDTFYSFTFLFKFVQFLSNKMLRSPDSDLDDLGSGSMISYLVDLRSGC